MNKVVYKKYLKSYKWKKKRKRVLNRDKWTCQVCGGRGWVVHHLTYRRIYKERLKDLMTVCDYCHKKIHGII